MTRTRASVATALLVAGVVGCSPKVQVEPPSEPITINLNVKIEHEIRVKVDKDLDDVFAEQQDRLLSGRTWYNQLGDIVVWMSLVTTAMVWLMGWRHAPRRRE